MVTSPSSRPPSPTRCRRTSRWLAPPSTAWSRTGGCSRSGPPRSVGCSTPRSRSPFDDVCPPPRAHPRGARRPAVPGPRGRPPGRPRADHGRVARRPREPDGRRARAGGRRPGGGLDLRQPPAVRAGRGSRPLPPHAGGGPQDLRARRRRHRLRAGRRGGLPGGRPDRRDPRRRHHRARAARRDPRGTGPARPLPWRADGRGQAVRPGPSRRRGLRAEGLPAARADPAAGPRPLPGARGGRRTDPAGGRTGWR